MLVKTADEDKLTGTCLFRTWLIDRSAGVVFPRDCCFVPIPLSAMNIMSECTPQSDLQKESCSEFLGKGNLGDQADTRIKKKTLQTRNMLPFSRVQKFMFQAHPLVQDSYTTYQIWVSIGQLCWSVRSIVNSETFQFFSSPLTFFQNLPHAKQKDDKCRSQPSASNHTSETGCYDPMKERKYAKSEFATNPGAATGLKCKESLDDQNQGTHKHRWSRTMKRTLNGEKTLT